MVINKKNAYKMFITACILLPILFQYAGIATVTIGDLFLMISFAVLCFFNSNIIIKKEILFLIIYILLLSMLLILQDRFETDALWTTLRYIVYLICIAVMPNVLSESKFAITFYKKICMLVSYFFLLQYALLKVFDYCLPGVLQFFKLTDESLYDYRYAIYYTNSRRCMSVFGEPSHYAIYVLPFLILILFKKSKIEKKEMADVLVVSLTILLSSSFTGILGMLFIWGIWGVNLIKKINVPRKIVWVILLGIGAITIVLLLSDVVNYIFNIEIYSRHASERFVGFSYVFEEKSSLFEKLFGHGMKDVGREIYLAGWPRLFYYFGYVGSSVYVYTLMKCGRKKTNSILILYLTLILMVGTEMNFGPLFLPYIILIFVSTKFEIVPRRNDLV